MRILFKIIHFLSSADPEYGYGPIQDWMLGQKEVNVFVDTLLLVIGIAVVVSALYYFVFNIFLKMNYRWAWFLFAIIVVGVSFGVTYSYIGSYVYPVGELIMPFGWKFMAENSFWGFVLFYLSSLLFKRWSTFAKNIPH